MFRNAPGTADVAVVTVVYNDLDGLRRTTESVDICEIPKIEHIVLDGNGGDGAAEWLASRNSPAHPFTYISGRDFGIYDAMNRSLEYVSAPYVLFLNAGDTLTSPCALGDFLQGLKTSGKSWGFAPVVRLSQDRYLGSKAVSSVKYGDVLKGRDWIPHQGTVFNAAQIRAKRGYDPQYGMAADQALILECWREAEPYRYSQPLANYLADGAHSTISPLRRNVIWWMIRCDLENRGSVALFAGLLASTFDAASTELRRLAKKQLASRLRIRRERNSR